MIEITAEIRALIDKAAAGVELAGDEYIDPADGLIHCKKCGGQRQTVVPCFGKPGYFMPRCICQCQREAEEQRKTAEERQRRMERIKRRKAQGLQDRYLYDYTFSNDNGQNPLMDKAHAYVENWKEAYKSNIGLLLFGDVGTGKSFFAGCIANALLDRDVPVLMTNFPTILNRLTGMFSEDRSEFIASFDEYDLLIIDDLGVERSTEYAMRSEEHTSEPVTENRRTPFQNTVIDTGVGQIRRVFQLGQFQVCCDNHGPAAAVAAVDDEKHLLHSIFGTALYSQIVNDKQVIFIKAGNKL